MSGKDISKNKNKTLNATLSLLCDKISDVVCIFKLEKNEKASFQFLYNFFINREKFWNNMVKKIDRSNFSDYFARLSDPTQYFAIEINFVNNGKTNTRRLFFTKHSLYFVGIDFILQENCVQYSKNSIEGVSFHQVFEFLTRDNINIGEIAEGNTLTPLGCSIVFLFSEAARNEIARKIVETALDPTKQIVNSFPSGDSTLIPTFDISTEFPIYLESNILQTNCNKNCGFAEFKPLQDCWNKILNYKIEKINKKYNEDHKIRYDTPLPVDELNEILKTSITFNDFADWISSNLVIENNDNKKFLAIYLWCATKQEKTSSQMEYEKIIPEVIEKFNTTSKILLIKLNDNQFPIIVDIFKEYDQYILPNSLIQKFDVISRTNTHELESENIPQKNLRKCKQNRCEKLHLNYRPNNSCH